MSDITSLESWGKAKLFIVGHEDQLAVIIPKNLWKSLKLKPGKYLNISWDRKGTIYFDVVRDETEPKDLSKESKEKA